MRARVELSFVRRFSGSTRWRLAVPVRRVTKAARGRAIEEHGQAGDGTGSHRSVPVALVIVVVKMHNDHGEPGEPQVPDVRKSPRWDAKCGLYSPVTFVLCLMGDGLVPP